MHFSALEYALWTAVTIADAVLLYILIRKDLWQRFPFFAGYTAFDFVREIIFWPALSLSPEAFFYMYWGLSLFGSILHLALIYELFRMIFQPLDVVPRAALKIGAICCITIASATALWCWGFPISMAHSIPAFMARCNLLLSALRFSLFGFVAVFSRALGLHWRHYVFGIAAGLGLYSGIDLLTTALHAQFDLMGAYPLHQINKAAYLLAMVAWCCILQRDEPYRAPVTPAMRELLSNIKFKLETYQHYLGVSK